MSEFTIEANGNLHTLRFADVPVCDLEFSYASTPEEAAFQKAMLSALCDFGNRVVNTHIKESENAFQFRLTTLAAGRT